MRMFKIISLPLNAFVPNALESAIAPSFFDPKIYHCFKPASESPPAEDDIKKDLEYCKAFVDNCDQTNFKLLHYLRFKEYEIFFKAPMDEQDAFSVAGDIIPYRKNRIAKKYTGELFPWKKENIQLLAFEPDNLENRVNSLFKPLDLTDAAINGKIVETISKLPHDEVKNFMMKIEVAFIVQQELYDLVFDLAVLNWSALDTHFGILKTCGFVPSSKSVSLYASFGSILANHNSETYITGLQRLFATCAYRRDMNHLRILFLSLSGICSEEERKELAHMSVELVKGLKDSEYPLASL